MALRKLTIQLQEAERLEVRSRAAKEDRSMAEWVAGLVRRELGIEAVGRFGPYMREKQRVMDVDMERRQRLVVPPVPEKPHWESDDPAESEDSKRMRQEQQRKLKAASRILGMAEEKVGVSKFAIEDE